MNQKQIEEILHLTNELAISAIQAAPKNIVILLQEKIHGQDAQGQNRK